MTRNTLRRVEVAVPVYDNGLKCRIREMFLTMMSDNVKARVQQPDGSYKIEPDGDSSLNAQESSLKKLMRPPAPEPARISEGGTKALRKLMKQCDQSFHGCNGLLAF